MGSKILKAALKKLLSTASDLRCDLRAITAVEFALVAPFALLLLFGEYTMCDAMSVKRKLMITAHTIADLVARQQSLTASGLSTIINASAQVIAPYSSAKLSLVISELYTDANGNTTVSWSKALNGTALTQGAKLVLPNGIAENNTYLIYSNASYAYTPIIGQSIFGNTMNFNSQFYTNPRASTQITLSN
jgi:Flp pilus assembly protein TadG